jgi:glutathione S-transferase
MMRSSILSQFLKQQKFPKKFSTSSSNFSTSNFSTTTSSSIDKPKFRYLSAWFCPFAHRATLALEHHASKVDYEWIEALGWEQRKDEHNVTGTGQEWWYHWKADELKRVNPSALVPTLIQVDTSTGESNEDQVVFESLVTIDFVDHVSGATGGGMSCTV